ncbi:MAG: transposase [Bacteroidota bacterium]
MKIEKRNDAVTNIHDEIRSDRCPKKSEDKIHQQLTEILSFSYTTEHYNSSKIFFNNDKQKKKLEEIEIKKRRNRKSNSFKPTKSIKIRRRIKCPICGLMPLKESKKTTEKITVDLKFTQKTIVKEIRKYWANRSYCKQCKKDFTPPYFNVHGHPGIYGRNIKIWVCYLRIVLRNPYSLIRKITADLFKLNLSDAVIIRFIEEVGSYYLETEKILISSVLKRKFIHIDETTINIKGQNQYVWVLRNDDSVYLKHTETRENEFIKNLLKNYAGIIITDFYTGYDNVNCIKQRCWVHLIREINNALWQAPFDKEFQLFVEALRDLLLPIMKTIQKSR